MSFYKFSVLSLLVGAGLAAPALEKKDDHSSLTCGDYIYKDVTSEQYLGDWFLANALSCTSGKESCEITQAYANGMSVETSIGGGAGSGLDLGKIASLGAEVGFSVTWGKSTETSMGVTMICPGGGITCSIAARPLMVKTTGKARRTGYCASGAGEWKDFQVIAPATMNSNGGQTAMIDFDICMKTCYNTSGNYPNSCPDFQSGSLGISYCPNYPPAGNYPWGNL